MTRDVSVDHPERVAELTRRSRTHFDRSAGDAAAERAPLEIPPEIQERLSSLGYRG